MSITLKRAYETPSRSDGCRILVERLWPRGLSKEKAEVDFWARDLAPSNDLRRWYQHDPDKWPEFRRRYFAEVAKNRAAAAMLIATTSGRVRPSTCTANASARSREP